MRKVGDIYGGLLILDDVVCGMMLCVEWADVAVCMHGSCLE